MKVLITGSSGFIGSALVESFEQQGHQVAKLVRDHDLLNDNSAFWDPSTDTIDIPKLDWIAKDEGFRAVIHLAGKNIMSVRWSPETKPELKESRVKSTKLLAGALTRLKVRPSVFISASGVGYYGDRGNEILNEDHGPGTNFIAEMAVEWEAATSTASEAGIRTVNSRFGSVLSTKGGALKKMIPLFKIGAGAPLGEGNQYMSWITIEDTVRAINHIIMTETLEGPVNITATTPVTNIDFSRILGYYFKAPIVMHVPAFMLHLMFGDVANDVMLASARVMPVKLIQSGFKFRHTKLEPALKDLVAKNI